MVEYHPVLLHPGTRRVIPDLVTTRSGTGGTYYPPGTWTRVPGYPVSYFYSSSQCDIPSRIPPRNPIKDLSEKAVRKVYPGYYPADPNTRRVILVRTLDWVRRYGVLILLAVLRMVHIKITYAQETRNAANLLTSGNHLFYKKKNPGGEESANNTKKHEGQNVLSHHRHILVTRKI